MGLRKTATVSALLADADVDIGTVYLGNTVARVVGFWARNFASAAEAAEGIGGTGGTDTAVRVKLVDADGTIFYLDAADKDYTAGSKRHIELDDTVTDLTVLAVDATGAAAAAAAVQAPIARSPVTISVINGGTATDYFSIYLIVDDASDRSTRK